MAINFYSTQANTQNTLIGTPGASASDRLDGHLTDAKVLNAKIDYTMNSVADGGGEVVALMRMPQNTKIHADLCNVYCDNPGTALSIDVGDHTPAGAALDADRYCDQLDIAAGGFFWFTGGGTRADALETPFVTTQDSWLTMTFHTDTSTVTDDVALRFSIYYSHGGATK